jgi:hypothetical protein
MTCFHVRAACLILTALALSTTSSALAAPPNIHALLVEARARQARGDLNGAYDVLNQIVGTKVVRPSEVATKREAAALLAEVDPLIPFIGFELAALGETLSGVVLDGAALPRAEWLEPQPVNPGRHSVVAQLRDGSSLEETFSVGERGRLRVAFRLPPPKASPPPIPATRTEPPKPRASPVKKVRKPTAVPSREPAVCPADQTPRGDECIRTTKYTYQLAIVDGSTAVAYTAAFAAESGALLLLGVSGTLLSSPIVHWSHGHVGRGFASMGIHTGAMLTSVSAAAQFSAKTTTLGAGFVVGTLVGFGLDYLALGHDDETRSPAVGVLGVTSPTLGVMPLQGGLAASLGGAF